MLSIGINLGSTGFGKTLKDGGTCILDPQGVRIALAEERITKRKAEGGFENSFNACCSSLELDMKDADILVYSSCCELPRQNFKPEILTGHESKIVCIPSHHLSHALSAFLVSPFSEAIVLVIDSGGNILDSDMKVGSEWWKHCREQHSYYLGQGTKCNLVDRDFDQPFEVGVGELYRAFTKFLGWESYIYSGKTMALSAYGDENRFKGVELFWFDGDRLRSKFRNNPLDPIHMIQSFAHQHNISFGHPRKPDCFIEDIHKDIACFIQKQSEQAIIEKVRRLYKKYKVKNLCIAGGVGLNCAINAKILEHTDIENIFIQPAAGDQGQCLGNALYGLFEVLGAKDRFTMETASLGISYSLTQEAVSEILNCYENLRIVQTLDIYEESARLIASGSIIAWFQGKSEFGPRALGNRSILADPRFVESQTRLNNQIKTREYFLPYGPSILEEYASQYFDSKYLNPFMLLAPKVKTSKSSEVPAVVHIDGTSRLQVVTKKTHSNYHQLIEAFYRRTGVPMLLNTSLNPKGSPICETPHDAIDFFAKSCLDYLVIGEILIERISEFSAMSDRQ
jgi:carbamoyltransferase